LGERLITSTSSPVFDGVYKLTAVEDAGGNIIPKIKISENTGKITTPHFKRVYRLFDRKSGKAIADQLCVHDESLDDAQPITLFDPLDTWKEKTVTDFFARELLVPVFKNGEQVYEPPKISEIRSNCLEQVASLWDEVTRFEYPHNYYVDLSRRLWNVKQELLKDPFSDHLHL
jgi:nicotinate phosphoribosyltransferase